MTSAIAQYPSSADPARRGDDPYDGIEPWFEKMVALDPHGLQWRRLREEIIGRCLPLAEHIARRYTGRGVEFEDLLQVARVGLLEAVNRFDPDRGPSFVGFAVPTIMGEVRRYFRDRTWSVRVPRRLKELQGQVQRVLPELTQRLGRVPTASDVAAELGLERAEIVQVLVASNGYRSDSLDAPLDNGEGGNPQVVMQQLGTSEPGYALMEESITVGPLLGQLCDQDRDVLIWRYFEGCTQDQIATRLGVSQMQVSRILARILASLREQVYAEPAGVPQAV
ncbi:SigB/SigF/SigG family RNA polymerase sigma factor [Nocardia alni]|uniref:SigB/SigF/SigG family RNA polymerase sigma factor n=1 Tax=Nocardia alni TaxID=2815723 RepID=UPI001C24C549|nr:SigB/SigF/SigG family RNA polymerase sigma factor [Nocardia alni]